MTKQYTLGQLAAHLDASVVGDSDYVIDRIATLSKASPTEIAFLANKKYRNQLDQTNAGAVIVSQEDAVYFSGNKIVVENAYIAYAHLAQMMDTTPVSASNIHSSAVIHGSVQLSDNVSIGANAVIEAGVILGEHVQIGPGCFVGRNTKIGHNTKLWANVMVYHDVVIGDDCLFQSGAVIGSDGFGYANEAGKWIKIPQVGSVNIGNGVEVGANTVIDRGALDDTIIHDNVILDNLIQIAHNVEIGEGTAIAAATVIAGSSTIGKHCQIAGLVGINGHIDICDGVIITGMTMVTKAITESGVYSSGIPHSANKEWRRNIAHFRNLSEFKQRLKSLEALTEQLQNIDD
ncbi:UDP-3-O-(3-hydroxymyristoyl)glucosamine N-acyltransferase [Pseudoalteromonas aurantia]|uniref:UDP-3-O-acylglucosamine N-acyltransferase n=1 Tax=Pseudoalteromonas aurantia TaxID=43654 RepID=A0A5S3VAQ6_9GAMM|nr:UDP-3-O-(3-hydroxymyristoyl)glucosamine N-acyltransferase [Pseudoalteromonas aurantia]TMO66588.1 UDP-3-O-(3-hydroxymyristoyl)glucosamine N-acyltransferase [Pseudoalteromonas aurantia]TMO68950.1 UDP-3-O-(3-hydroxymyristoyl)glucosamine N-acyltransferase [Pseudoalteromonas aurantia]TMO71804.1 UDP-3-O-(3-hydroxymyristoyl)glucosamine N-acyltransferase [Pseudoalteromonas aurantia]